MKKLIKNIQKWQRSVFPEGTPNSIFAHLTKEIIELSHEVTCYSFQKSSTSALGEEIADCMILLVGIADRANIDIVKAVKTKHKKNKQRTWGDPDRNGVIEHIKDE